MMTTHAQPCKPGSPPDQRGLFDPPPPPPPLPVTWPPHGIPDALAGALAELLAEARRMRDRGRPRAEVIGRVLAANRRLPVRVPVFSAGGLVETLDAVLVERPGVAHG